MSTRKSIFFVLPTLMCLVLFLACSSTNSVKDLPRIISAHRSTDVCGRIVDLLNDNRIVLLGDQGHQQWQYKQTVIDVLDAWFRSVAADSTDPEAPRSLTLILETDSVRLAEIQAYMHSGRFEDIYETLTFVSGTFTTAHLEFYWRLGELRNQIEAFNASQPDSAKVHLDLFGPEPVIGLDDWSFEKRDEYSLHARDSLVAEDIAGYVKHHPHEAILAFYGSAHLQRGLIMKETESDSAKGTYLATYLECLYPGRVVTIGQVAPDYWGPYQDLFSYRDTTFLISTANADKSLQRILAGPLGFDCYIVFPRLTSYGTEVGRIPSMNSMRLAIASLQKMMNPSNDYYLAEWKSLITYFNAVSGRMPHRVNLADTAALQSERRQWIDWSAHTDSDIVPDIVNLRLWTRLADSLSHDGPAAGSLVREFNRFLPGRRPLYSLQNLPSPSELSRQMEQEVASNRKDIVTDALIGLLWVGNGAEQASAQKALTNLTGQTFTDPADWADWRRHNPMFLP